MPLALRDRPPARGPSPPSEGAAPRVASRRGSGLNPSSVLPYGRYLKPDAARRQEEFLKGCQWAGRVAFMAPDRAQRAAALARRIWAAEQRAGRSVKRNSILSRVLN